MTTYVYNHNMYIMPEISLGVVGIILNEGFQH